MSLYDPTKIIFLLKSSYSFPYTMVTEFNVFETPSLDGNTSNIFIIPLTSVLVIIMEIPLKGIPLHVDTLSLTVCTDLSIKLT